MSIHSVGLQAYSKALENFAKARKANEASHVQKTLDQKVVQGFEQTLHSSLQQVNSLQKERADMINSFASGETQNVHELMISMQKASLAMNMTAAVRNKVLEAYKELSRLQF